MSATRTDRKLAVRQNHRILRAIERQAHFLAGSNVVQVRDYIDGASIEVESVDVKLLASGDGGEFYGVYTSDSQSPIGVLWSQCGVMRLLPTEG